MIFDKEETENIKSSIKLTIEMLNMSMDQGLDSEDQLLAIEAKEKAVNILNKINGFSGVVH